MTPQQKETLLRFIEHYEHICDMFCIKPEKHVEYLRVKELLNEEE